MANTREELAEIINSNSPSDGLFESMTPGVHCIKISRTEPRTNRHWHAALNIVAQGCKEIILDREVYRCDAAHYVVTPIDLPVTSRVLSATAENPFLCLKIDFDPLVLGEIAAQLDSTYATEIDTPFPAIFIGKASKQMLDAAVRLGRHCQSLGDAKVLAPLVVREILYHLLMGSDGPAIWQFVRAGSKTHQITQAIFRLRSELARDVDVEDLAKEANMSRSAFFKRFKEVTAMSPIQYQKRLRLLEARRLMTEEGESAESAAFCVGYNSASQFSREYSRMFGRPPLRDASKIIVTGNPIHQI